MLTIVGATEVRMIRRIMGMRYLSTPGTVSPRTNPKYEMPTAQISAPITLKNRNCPYRILPTPASIGAKVRTIGMKRARMMVLPPWRS